MPVTNYIWDVVSDNLLMETDENDEVIATYQHEPTLHGELNSMTRGGKTYYYHYDGEGNTVAVTDENQNVVEEATYSAFGEVIEKASSIVNPFGYKGALGYYTNGDTNDLYVRARPYQPATGRWMTADPLWPIDGANGYVYVHNSPSNYSDFTGFAAVSASGKITFRLRPINQFGNPNNLIGGLPSVYAILSGTTDDNCTFSEVTFKPEYKSRLLWFKEELQSDIIRDTVSDTSCCGGMECARAVAVGIWSATKLTLIPVPVAKLWQFGAQAILKAVTGKAIAKLLGVHLVGKVQLTICANGSFSSDYDAATNKSLDWEWETDFPSPSTSAPPELPKIPEEEVK